MQGYELEIFPDCVGDSVKLTLHSIFFLHPFVVDLHQIALCSATPI
jgi:hypothetical protein